MEKTKEYQQTRFSADVLRKASTELYRGVNFDPDKGAWMSLSVDFDDERWTYDSEEEFFAAYRRSPIYALYTKHSGKLNLTVRTYRTSAQAEVMAPERSKIEAVFEVFESHLQESRLAKPPPSPQPKPTVFIGHGKSELWRDLKDHLHDKHGYPVEAYEIGARAGHQIRDVLEEMLRKTSLAFLVMTGEDKIAEGEFRARQNVVHEIGLFQGRLGFSKAIVLLEEGTEEFSNIEGAQQIRFGRGKIKETFGEVLAVIRRESPESTT